MKVIFLDIDGVLNSTRSCVAHNGYPWPDRDWHKFDMTAVSLLRKAVAKTDAVCVLSSTWRSHLKTTLSVFADFLGVEIHSCTRDAHSTEPRGAQIADWLKDHPTVENWAILDDSSDMFLEQMERLVKVNGCDGFSYRNYAQLIDILGKK